MSKINWLTARSAYVSNDELSYEDIAQKYSVSKSQVVRIAKRDNWIQLRQEAKQTATDLLPKNVGEAIAQINARHIQMGRKLQTIGMEAIDAGLTPKTIDHARKLVDSGVALERKAAGIDQSERAPNVNILTLINEEREKYGF